MYKIIEYKNDYRDSWNAFAKEHGDIFHLIEWKEILEETFGYKSIYLMAVDMSNNLVGLIPILSGRNLLMKKAGISLPFVNYLNICCKDAGVHKFIIEQIRQLPDRFKLDYLELRIKSKQTDANTEESYMNIDGTSSDNTNYTFVLPLEGNEENVMSFSTGSNRNHTRKTYKNKWFSATTGSDKLDAFYNVYCKTVKRLGSPAPAFKFFQKIIESFPDSAKILTVSDNDNGCIVGGMFLFLWKDTIFYYWGGALAEYNKKYINNFMYWEAVKFGISNGFKYLDLGRSALGSGTYRFKEQWGAQPIQLNYFHFERECRSKSSENKHIGIKKDDFGIFISMWKHTPSIVTDLVGKHLIKYIMP